MRDAFICEAVRTPLARRGGSYRNTRSEELVAAVLNELVKRTGLAPLAVEDVAFGCVTQIGEQGYNIARLGVLAAGWPVDVPGTSMNRMCGSGQQACNFQAAVVMAGQSDVLVGGGVEHMTHCIMGTDNFDPQSMNFVPVSEKITDRYEIVSQGISAEMVAEKWGISREELDAFSYQSHQRAIKAIDQGYFQRETFPLPGVNKEGAAITVAVDEHPRRDTTLERLASLVPAFKMDGKVTAGNSSGIEDGASALLIASEEGVKCHNLKPRARFVSTQVVGVDPTIMLTGPMPATEKALKKAGLKLDDIGLFEVNEAFASVVLAYNKQLEVDPEKVNVNGGAIALGHPLGASGARLLTTLLHEMERRQVRYGLSTMCIGFGQGIATVIERV